MQLGINFYGICSDFESKMVGRLELRARNVCGVHMTKPFQRESTSAKNSLLAHNEFLTRFTLNSQFSGIFALLSTPHVTMHLPQGTLS
mmetsp:Transcript_5176/g.5899  ORF Transcript_5176/g.5899 Transcript_5176/m.5899 type:complete len:88 (+) Transcript_5176:525-788(+)